MWTFDIFFSAICLIFMISMLIMGAHFAMNFKKPEFWPRIVDDVPRTIPEGGWDDWTIDERRAYADLYGKPARKDREILWFVRWWGDQNLESFWLKPVYGCQVCQASLWSILPVHLFLTYSNLYLFDYSFLTYVVIYLMFMCAVAGLNRIILSKIDLI